MLSIPCMVYLPLEKPYWIERSCEHLYDTWNYTKEFNLCVKKKGENDDVVVYTYRDQYARIVIVHDKATDRIYHEYGKSNESYSKIVKSMSELYGINKQLVPIILNFVDCPIKAIIARIKNGSESKWTL